MLSGKRASFPFLALQAKLEVEMDMVGASGQARRAADTSVGGAWLGHPSRAA